MFVRLLFVLTERRVLWFAVPEAATAGITAGWLLHLTVRLGRLILAIAGPNFLGLGVQAPTPEGRR